jgi:hypothetical protein
MWARLKAHIWWIVAELLLIGLIVALPSPWAMFATALALLLFPFILMAIYWRPPKRED